MKSFEYVYEAQIVRIDEANRVMDVLYRSEGREDVLCGVRLPETADDIGETIESAVPFGVWQEAERSVFVPPVGTIVRGVIRSEPDHGLPAPESPAISFTATAEHQDGYMPAGDEPHGFPGRYVADGGETQSSEPEVTL